MRIELRHVSKRFGAFAALRDVGFAVADGELLALLGPSGCGKTTVLRIIAGLETPDAGAVWFDGNEAGAIAARDRGVGFVFQHYALFRHLSVFENVAFGLRVRPRRTRPSDDEIRRRVRDLLQLVQLEHLGGRYPSQLSGGQRQRVALARALAVEPRVLLLDEPFGALDAQVRQELRQWLRRLHRDVRLTTVFVTHDQEEALELADRVIVMNKGQVEQDATPEALLEHPATPFVLHFLGHVNVFPGRVRQGCADLGPLRVAYPQHLCDAARDAAGYARPHECEISDQDTGDGFWSTVRDVRAAGAVIRIDVVDATEATRRIELSRDAAATLPLFRGARVYVKPRRLHVFVH